MRADARHIGQFVDTFLLDHRAVHIGQQHAPAPPLRGLHHQIQTHGLQILPDLPAVVRHGGQRELCGLVRVQPDHVAPAPSIPKRFQQTAFKIARLGIGKNGGDEHGASFRSWMVMSQIASDAAL